jgi:aspartokinase
MKNYKVTISVGDKIAVGKFRNSVKIIKEITMEDDQPVVVTSAGKRKLLNFKLVSKTKKKKDKEENYNGPWNGIV